MKKVKMIGFSIFFYLLISCSNQHNIEMKPKETSEQLIQRIAENMQSLAPMNLGGFQLMLIKKSIETKNYTYEELQNLDRIIAERIESQKVFQTKFTWMYENLMSVIKAKKIELSLLENQKND